MINDVSVCGNQDFDVSSEVNFQYLHKKGNSFPCNYCDKVYPFQSLLKIHLGSHTKPFKCDYCLKCFTRRGDLKRHWRVHSGEKPYKCNVCSYTTANFSSLKLHVKAKHKTD